MKCVIGIDPSITKTAVCVLNQDASYEIRTYSAPKLKRATVEDRIARLWEHAGNIAMFTGVHSSQCDLVLLEGYSYGSRYSAIPLAEFGGLLRRNMQLAGLLGITKEVAPATLKQFATGKGTSGKDIVVAALTHRYKVLLGGHDEYDAFGLAKLAAVVAGWDLPTNDAQRKAMAKVQGG